METWKIIVCFRNGDTMTECFNSYPDALKRYIYYWSMDIIKAILDRT